MKGNLIWFKSKNKLCCIVLLFQGLNLYCSNEIKIHYNTQSKYICFQSLPKDLESKTSAKNQLELCLCLLQ